MKWLKFILYIFLFSIGWMFELFVEHWDVFHLSFDVPAFNIINLLVISLLAWLVNYTIQKSGRKVKSHIDLLSDKIDEVVSESFMKMPNGFKNLGSVWLRK